MEDYQKYLEQITEEYNKSKRKAHRCLIIFFLLLVILIFSYLLLRISDEIPYMKDLFIIFSCICVVMIVPYFLILRFVAEKYTLLNEKVKLDKTRIMSIEDVYNEYNQKLNVYTNNCEQINIPKLTSMLKFKAYLSKSYAKSIDIIVNFDDYYLLSDLRRDLEIKDDIEKVTHGFFASDVRASRNLNTNSQQIALLKFLKDELNNRNDIFYNMLLETVEVNDTKPNP